MIISIPSAGIKGIPAGFADGIDNSSGESGTPDSISWANIKDIPADFADGVDNIGEYGSSPDSVRAAFIADTCKKYPTQTLADGAVTTDKIAAGAVSNEKITWPEGTDGQVWKMGADGQPAWGTDLQGTGGATTIAGITGLADSLTSHRTLINSKANASDLAGKADISHTHTQTDITGLSTTLSSLQSDIDSKADETDLAGKANTADVYTKTEVDDLVSSAGGDATGVEYSSISTVQNYVSLSSANTSVQSITVSCPEDGYIVVSGNASVMYVTGASASLVSIQCKVTLNTTTLSGACSQVNFAPSPSDMENITVDCQFITFK